MITGLVWMIATVIGIAIGIRLSLWLVRFIYNAAPAIVLWALLIGAIFYYEAQENNNRINLQKDYNAGATQSVKN